MLLLSPLNAFKQAIYGALPVGHGQCLVALRLALDEILAAPTNAGICEGNQYERGWGSL